MSAIKSEQIEYLGKMFDAILQLGSTKRSESDGFNNFAKEFRRQMGKTGWEYCANLRSPTSPRPDFTSEITRDGYIYRYMLRHTYLVFIASMRNYKTLFGKGPPSSICAIGGGPGCDVIGIMKACKMPLDNCQIHILDRCLAWEQSWNALHENVPPSEKPPEVTYHRFDFNENDLNPTLVEVIEGADIVTMIKSLSPVTAMLREKTPEVNEKEKKTKKKPSTKVPKTSLYSILRSMKPGSLFMYIDNRTGTQRGVLEDTLAHLSFTVVDDEGLGKGAWVPSRDVFADNRSRQEYRNRMKTGPCTRAGKNELILLRKDK